MNIEEVEKQRALFCEAAKPLIKYINEYGHPHMRVLVDCDSAELLSGEMSIEDTSFTRG
jgi:hypothetical protein